MAPFYLPSCTTFRALLHKFHFTENKNMDTFYQQDFLKWTGQTLNDKILYSEVTADYLLNHLELLDRISCVGLESYLVNHTPSPNGEGNIRKRSDGRWEGRYTAGRDPDTGKVIYKNVLAKT